jgi:hypothetical protein
MIAFPNMYVEIGAVIAELGRQPRAAKKFFDKYQDSVLFGKDSWVPAEYATYFRVLETEDEYFPYHKKYHAFWRMYGMGLVRRSIEKALLQKCVEESSRDSIKVFSRTNSASFECLGFAYHRPVLRFAEAFFIIFPGFGFVPCPRGDTGKARVSKSRDTPSCIDRRAAF